MVEMKELPNAVLVIVLVGIVIGVGVIVLDQFGVAIKQELTYNDTLTISSGTATATNDDIVSVSYFGNSTLNDTTVTTTTTHVNFTSAGVFNVNTSRYGDGTYTAIYNYDADSSGTTAIFTVRDASDDFVTWIPVIVIILAAAVILVMVMRSFRQ